MARCVISQLPMYKSVHHYHMHQHDTVNEKQLRPGYAPRRSWFPLKECRSFLVSRISINEGGGTLINQNPHQLDLWQWLFGMPDRLMADVSFGKYYHIEVDDDVTCILKYDNGTTGVYMTSTGEAPGTNRLDISCDMGRIVVENDRIFFDRNAMSERQWNAEGHNDDVPFVREEIPVTYEWEINEGLDRNFADAT